MDRKWYYTNISLRVRVGLDVSEEDGVMELLKRPFDQGFRQGLE